MKWLIATSDNLSYILKPYAWLMDKYLPEITDIHVLGYSVFPELPEKFKCVSLAEKQISLDTWTRNLYNYIKDIEDEFVVFTLEDLLPIRSIDYEIYDGAFEIMKNNSSIGRYELGTGHCWHNWDVNNHFFETSERFSVYLYGYESLYRISTQTSIWRRKYLLQYLDIY
jgi:hypothetical protein